MCACLICLSCLKPSYWYGNILHFSREEDSCVWRQLCMPHSPFVPLLSRSSFICFPLILLLYIPLLLHFLHFLLLLILFILLFLILHLPFVLLRLVPLVLLLSYWLF